MNMNDAEAAGLMSELKEFALSKGISDIGFGPFSVLTDVKKLGDGGFDFPSAICMLAELPLDAVKGAKEGPSADLRESYKVANRLMMGVAKEMVQKLESAGYSARLVEPALRVDPESLLGPVSLKSIARTCGLGWIGKAGLFVTPEYGPRVRMIAILTDMPVGDAPKTMDSECGDCRECIDNCALKVLNDQSFASYPPGRDSVIDWKKCGKFENRLIGDGSEAERACGKCMAFCPLSYS